MRRPSTSASVLAAVAATVVVIAATQLAKSHLGASASTSAPVTGQPTIKRVHFAADGTLVAVGPTATYVSSDQGSHFASNPLPASVATVADAEFSADGHGLAVAATTSGALATYLTADNGKSWRQMPITPTEAVSEATVALSPDGSGWVAARNVSSSNFSFGELFSIPNTGPAAHQTLPGFGRVRFFSSTLGFVAGGADGDHLWRTTDGGGSWVPSPLVVPADAAATTQAVGDPTMLRPEQGYIPVTTLDEGGRITFAVEKTNDGGASWSASGSPVALSGGIGPGVPVASDVSGSAWTAIAPDGSSLVRSVDGGTTWTKVPVRGLSGGVVDTRFSAANTQVGVATTMDGTTTVLWRTVDGGQHWSTAAF